MLKQSIKKVEQSKVFKSFIKKHSDYYLVHCFTMADAIAKKYKWDLGYYSEKNDNVVVFESEPKVSMKPAEEAFKKEGTIKKLDIKKVKVSVSKALELCNNLLIAKYPREIITKRIIILQHLEKQVYNITLVSMSFNILNIRIDANTGEVIKDNIQSIISLGKK